MRQGEVVSAGRKNVTNFRTRAAKSGMERLDEGLFDHLLNFLRPQDGACLCCVSRLFKKWIEESPQWRMWCYEAFPPLSWSPEVRAFLDGASEADKTFTYRGLYGDLVKPSLAAIPPYSSTQKQMYSLEGDSFLHTSLEEAGSGYVIFEYKRVLSRNGPIRPVICSWMNEEFAEIRNGRVILSSHSKIWQYGNIEHGSFEGLDTGVLMLLSESNYKSYNIVLRNRLQNPA